MLTQTKPSKTGPLIATLLFLATALAGCHEKLGDDDDDGSEIWIGLLTVLSGPAASLGQSGEKGMQLALAEINADGGIDGKTLRLSSGDDELNPTVATQEFQNIISDGKVQAVVGALASGITAAVIPLADDAQVALLSPASTRADLTRPRMSSYFFRDIPSDTIQGAKAASLLLNDLDVDATVVLYQNNAYASGLKDVFVGRYEEAGGDVSGEPIAFDEKDIATYAGPAQDAVARNPAHIWIAGQSPEIASVIKELRAAGYSGPLLTSEAIEDPAIFDVATSELDGVLFTKPDVDTSSAAYTAFQAAFMARFNEPVGTYSTYSYDAAYILADALEAGARTGTEIRDHLQATTFTGRVSAPSIDFNQDGDLSVGDYVLWEIRYVDGEGSFVERDA